MCTLMKVLFVSVLCLGLCGTTMAVDAWLTPTRIGIFDSNNVITGWDLAVAAKNGQFGLAYYTGGPGTRVLYNQLNYTAGTGGKLTVAVTDDRMMDGAIDPVDPCGQVLGLEFNASGVPVAAVAKKNSTDIRVFTRTGASIWPSEVASSQVPATDAAYMNATNNSFLLDSAGKMHLVYGGTSTVKYATNKTGSWVTTDLSFINSANPAQNFSDSAPTCHPSLALSLGGSPIVGVNIQGYVWYTSLIGAVETNGGNQPTINSIEDIAIKPDGNPIIAYQQDPTGKVKVADYNGISWSTSEVHDYGNPYNISNRNESGAVQIKIDHSGRPVVLVSSSSPTPDINQVKIDYYVLDGGVWTGTNVVTLQSNYYIQAIDFTFDEAGRPFVGFCYRPYGGDKVQAMYTSYGAPVCGSIGTTYLPGDLNKDCYVNMLDMKEFALQWLTCTTPGAAGCVSPAVLPFNIYQGSTVTVNGDLSDWADTSFRAMNTTLNGTPTDLTNAKWAAKWSPAANRIYMAVTGTDTYHYFNNSDLGWNLQDGVEVFVDAAESNVADYPDYDYEYAQQWVFGPNRGASAGIWGGGIWSHLGATAISASPSTYAVNVTGSTITYEFELPPYENWYGTPASSTYVTLTSGQTLGLDVVMRTITNSSLNFGMLCANSVGGKAQYAENFQTYTLRGTAACGDWGYTSADLYQDCKVDFKDFAAFAKKWMQCTDPGYPADCPIP